MNNIENIQEYIPTVYVNDSEPDLDETNLNKTEQAIKRVTDAANKAIDALKQLDREKLALSAISNVLSDATDKVPSLALANTMQLAINDLNSNLKNKFPSTYTSTGLTPQNCTLTGGGFARMGNTIIVNLRIRASAANQCNINGFPAGIAGNNIISCAIMKTSDRTSKGGYISAEGLLSTQALEVDSEYVISTVYLAR